MAELLPIAGSVDQLLDLVAHHVGTVTGLLTPELAAALLTLNTGNRPISEVGVKRFERIAAGGEWILTGEPLVLSRNGKLHDGQHRATAIVRSGQTVPVDIRFGASPEAFRFMGTGQRRTAGQALQIAGETFGAAQAGIARLIYMHDANLLGQKQAVETPLIVATAQANPAISAIAKAVGSAKFRPVRCAGFSFALVLTTRVAPIERVLEFMSLVSSGLSDSPQRPARMLHQRLMDASLKKQPLDQLEIAAITIRSWNAWVEARDLKQLRVRDTDRAGADFPKPLGLKASA